MPGGGGGGGGGARAWSTGRRGAGLAGSRCVARGQAQLRTASPRNLASTYHASWPWMRFAMHIILP